MNKPIIIFTNFWDAEKLVKDGYCITSYKDKLYKISLLKRDGKPYNFKVFSIALSAPSMDGLPTLDKIFRKIERIDIFCPTYKILTEYKQNKNWDEYSSKFKQLMKSRIDEVKVWLGNLIPNNVYLCCCWENTSANSKCHRKIIYDAFVKHNETNSNNVLIYRHGDKKEIASRSNIDLSVGLAAIPNNSKSLSANIVNENEIVRKIELAMEVSKNVMPHTTSSFTDFFPTIFSPIDVSVSYSVGYDVDNIGSTSTGHDETNN